MLRFSSSAHPSRALVYNGDYHSSDGDDGYADFNGDICDNGNMGCGDF